MNYRKREHDIEIVIDVPGDDKMKTYYYTTCHTELSTVEALERGRVWALSQEPRGARVVGTSISVD